MVYLQAALREKPPVVMLVGNKTDQQSKQVVTSEDGRELSLVSAQLQELIMPQITREYIYLHLAGASCFVLRDKCIIRR